LTVGKGGFFSNQVSWPFRWLFSESLVQTGFIHNKSVCIRIVFFFYIMYIFYNDFYGTYLCLKYSKQIMSLLITVEKKNLTRLWTV